MAWEAKGREEKQTTKHPWSFLQSQCDEWTNNKEKCLAWRALWGRNKIISTLFRKKGRNDRDCGQMIHANSLETEHLQFSLLCDPVCPQVKVRD